MNSIAPELFGKGGQGRVILLVAGLALFSWLVSEIVSAFSPKAAGMIKMLVVIFIAVIVYNEGKKAILTVIGMGIEVLTWIVC